MVQFCQKFACTCVFDSWLGGRTQTLDSSLLAFLLHRSTGSCGRQSGRLTRVKVCQLNFLHLLMKLEMPLWVSNQSANKAASGIASLL